MTTASTSTTGERRFPCTSCGAEVAFAPGVSMLACPYCGQQTDIPLDDDAEVRELCLTTMLAELDEHAPTIDRIVSHCDTCGADVNFPDNVTSTACPFCSANVVATGRTVKQIRPGAVLPFAIDNTRAREAYKTWLGKQWFSPRDLKKMATLNSRLIGVYIPYWTYDADATTEYRGERGDAYYETQWYTTMVNGKSVRRSRQVRKIRWRPARGRVFDRFDDVLIPASHSLPPETFAKLDRWNLKAIVPYTDAFLAGFQAESYVIPLREGFGLARLIMDQRIDLTIRRDIGGDEQRIHQKASTFSNMTYKHVLLPIWIMAYRYHDKTYQVLVNGQNGLVIGDRPYSWVKISGLIILMLIIFALILLFIMARN